MNKHGKKVLTFAVATIMATATVFATSADYMSGSEYESFLGHKADEWEYGNQWGLTGNYQYSYFYCKNEKHTATAVIKKSGRGGFDGTVKKEAKKGKTAKAQTKRYNDYDEWHSHFNHPNMK